MDEQEKSFFNYLEVALRRKWWIILPFLASILVSFGYYKYVPKIYKATTLILVQPQQIPENYVQSTIRAPVTDRLSTISQEILSRTRLEKVIHEFNLYPEARNDTPIEEIVQTMRKAIEVTVQNRSGSQNTFSISFEGEEPRTVMMVTNSLASLFIEENLKGRALQAGSTSEFLSKELVNVEEKLINKEDELRKFRERNMGQLPQQLDANLRISDRLQQELKTITEGIRAADDRDLLIQNQIDELKRWEDPRTRVSARLPSTSPTDDSRNENTSEDPMITQWNLLHRDLRNLRSRYTERHPEVIGLKRKIADLEPNVSELLQKQEADRAAKEAQLKQTRARREEGSTENLPLTDPALERLIVQHREQQALARLETKRLREEEKKLREQIALYQKRIEDTPKREQELVLRTRDYELLKTHYQSLLDKKIASQMAENLERRQQGEQFKFLDPARLPERPVKPNLPKILLMGLAIGLGSGLGLAWFRESLDESFHSEEDLEADLSLPILATIPNLNEERSLITRR